MRSVIREQLREGWSDARILDFFHQHYGDTILESPPLQGFTLLIWLAPLLMLLLGGFIVWTAGREWSRRAGRVAAEAVIAPRDALAGDAPASGDERARLLAELRRELELDGEFKEDRR
jgi:cytochrome c-type biogenesis protein CcmH/NrfF